MSKEVAVPWNIAYVIEYLRPKLQAGCAEFLIALNDHNKLADIESFPEWRDQVPIPLDAPWPGE